MNKLLIIVTIVFLLSCTSSNSENKKSTDTLNGKKAFVVNSNFGDFRYFINKFKLLSIPLSLNIIQINAKMNYPILFGSDTTFIKTEYKDTSIDKIYAYGLLPDTIKNFKVVWLEPTEMYIPVLTTFSKDGIKISEVVLSVGQCGSDCCYTCNETINIYKDLTVYSADSIKSCECDSIGPKENTMKKYVLFKTSKILSDGKIICSKMKKVQ